MNVDDLVAIDVHTHAERNAGEPQDPMALRPPLRPAVLRSDGTIVEGGVPAGPITDGTVLHRAPDDVGGLLDTSKGWTLNIPMPSDASSAAQAVAAQQHSPAGPTAPASTPVAALASAAQVASR